MSSSTSSSNNRSNRSGFAFRPTDEEIITFLTNMVLGRDSLVQQIAMFIAKLSNICAYEPWDLPGFSSMDQGDRVWYFFCQPNYKYQNSKRINRSTRAGSWKVTGETHNIKSTNGTVIGKKRILVFYQGSIGKRNGKRTCWVMHEYELISTLPDQKEWLFLYKLKKNNDYKADTSNSNVSQPSYDLPYVAVDDDAHAIISLDDLEDLDRPAAKQLAQGVSCLQSQPQMRTDEGQPSHDITAVAMEANANAVISLNDLGDMNELGAGQIDHVVSHLQPQMRSIYEENYHSLLSVLQPQMQGGQQPSSSSPSSWSFPLPSDSSCCSDTAQNHYHSGILNGDDEDGFWSSLPSLSPDYPISVTRNW